MNAGYIRITSGLTAVWIQQTLAATDKITTDDEVEDKNTDIIVEDRLRNLRQAKTPQLQHQDKGRKQSEYAENN